MMVTMVLAITNIVVVLRDYVRREIRSNKLEYVELIIVVYMQMS